jgi:uncharacterized Fe-S center protein
MEHMVEYAYGVLKGKRDKYLFINFINNVSPGCDCLPYNDAPIVRDIGVVASTDPVAIDQASARRFRAIQDRIYIRRYRPEPGVAGRGCEALFNF